MAKKTEDTAVQPELFLDLVLDTTEDVADIWDTDTTPRPAVPEGEFLVAVASWEPAYNEDKGSVGVNWTYTILSGEAAGKELRQYTYIGSRTVNAEGKAVLKNTRFSGNFLNAMKAVGLSREQSPELYHGSAFAARPEDVVGRLCWITVRHKLNEFNGEKFYRAEAYRWKAYENVGQRYDPETIEIPDTSDESEIEAF